MNKLFSEVPSVTVPRSVFNRPCSVKTTIGVDYLYPIFWDECLPSDTFSVSSKIFGRLSTPVVPIMDDLYLDMFWFAVPYRLVDPNWKKIMGESVVNDPNTETFEETNCPVLRIPASDAKVSTLHDYLGLPLGVTMDVLPYAHRAYNLIYNEWFRDENLCPFARVGGRTPSTTGNEAVGDYVLRRRAKVHDYFTSALPWPQKGNPSSVGFSLGSRADVFGTGDPLSFHFRYKLDGNEVTREGNLSSNTTVVNNSTVEHYVDFTNYHNKFSYPTTNTLGKTSVDDLLRVSTKAQSSVPGLYADLSTAQAVSINDLRNAFATQHFLEACSRGGTRYTETLLVHFGITTPDAVLQRPEFLASSSRPLNVTSVPQTSATDETSPQGNLSAFVTGTSDCHFVKTFTEHSLIMCIVNIRATVSYQQGIARKFSRRTRFDFYWPEFANLGEQTVLNKEIFAQGTEADNGVFGYQERYAEYRYNPNIITGRFRSTASQSLDVWHLAQKFSSLPVLGETFISSDTPITRSIAVTGQPHSQFILDGYIQMKCARPMPVHSVPGLSRL